MRHSHILTQKEKSNMAGWKTQWRLQTRMLDTYRELLLMTQPDQIEHIKNSGKDTHYEYTKER